MMSFLVSILATVFILATYKLLQEIWIAKIQRLEVKVFCSAFNCKKTLFNVRLNEPI